MDFSISNTNYYKINCKKLQLSEMYEIFSYYRYFAHNIKTNCKQIKNLCVFLRFFKYFNASVFIGVYRRAQFFQGIKPMFFA